MRSVRPLVVWDVGLGAASNAMAAILEVEASPASPNPRKLTLVSFENDLDSLELALDHVGWFKHLAHVAPRNLLAHGQWSNRSSTIEWQLTV